MIHLMYCHVSSSDGQESKVKGNFSATSQTQKSVDNPKSKY